MPWETARKWQEGLHAGVKLHANEMAILTYYLLFNLFIVFLVLPYNMVKVYNWHKYTGIVSVLSIDGM